MFSLAKKCLEGVAPLYSQQE